MIFTKKAPAATFGNIQSFLDNTRGQITIGEIPPIRRAALAAHGKKARVALVSKEGERQYPGCSARHTRTRSTCSGPRK